MSLKAKFHYAIWFEPASNQLRTSSEPASVMEFGFYCTIFTLTACVNGRTVSCIVTLSVIPTALVVQVEQSVGSVCSHNKF